MQKLTIAIALSLTTSLFGQNGLIVTVAGNGTTGTSGVGGPAVNASLAGGSICVDAADNFYIADRANNRVVKVDVVTGILTLVAGNGTASSAGDFGQARLASLNAPSGVAVDAAGNLFISEFIGSRVRRVDAATGIITTMAGNGTPAWAGDGGPAVNGSLKLPMGLALDVSSNLYIADAGNNRIRRVDAATGILTTVAGTGANSQSPDGTPAASASLATPMAVSFDSQGNLLISETFGNAIRRVSTTGLLSTVAGNGGTSFNGDGEAATSAALGPMYSNVASDASGNLYFADGIGRVRRVDASGIITTVAGSGAGAHDTVSSSGGGGGGSFTCPSGLGDNGPATLATLDGAAGVALTSSGRLLIPDALDCRVRSVQLPSPLLYTNTGLTLAGQTLTATVSPIGSSVTPTGTVQFMEYVAFGPPLPLTSATLSGGIATLDLSNLSAGSHQVMALYMGDGVYNGSGSVALGVTGSGRATPSLGTNIPYPVLVSTPVTLTITVAGSHGQGTGSLQISEGATLLGSPALVNGNGSFTFVSSVSGPHQITVQYSGDANYTPFSWTFTITVLAPSTVSLTADVNPANVGATVTFTGIVSPSNATGNMTFYDNGAILGLGFLTAGRAFLTTSTLNASTHSITATYNGDFVVAPATSPVLSETINLITPTMLSLSTSGSPSTFGQAVTFTANISPAAATGSVSFYDGGALLGTAGLSSGGASLTTSQLTVGSHAITAVYGGAGTYGPSNAPAFTQNVVKATPVVTLTSNTNPSVNGQSVVFTATLAPATATGSVQFLDGATVLATVTVTSGTASFSTATLAVGSHTISAVYSGDANNNGVTSGTVTQTVSKAATTTSLSAGSATIVYGQNVDLTATVTPASATGTVQFLDGAAVLVTLPVTGGTVPVVTATNLTVGSHLMTAVYSGDAGNNSSTSPVATVTVTKANTTIGLTSSVNPSANGQAVVFTAFLSPAGATGSVQFLDGATAIGTATVSGGTASVSTSALTPGSHSITVVYGGDANCNGATSAAVTQTVSKAPSTTALSSGSATIVYGQNVSLTASVTPTSATGTVQFLDGATVLATLPVTSGTVPVVTATNLAVGAHAMTAVYSGDASNSGSTSAAVTVTVTKASTTIGLTSSVNPSASGQAVIFTATLSPAGSTGSVQFLDGATAIGTATASGGTASLSTAGLAVGSHSITAVYGGDANSNGATSAVLTQTVSKASTTITLSASNGTIIFGQNVSLTASVAPSSASGTVQFLDGAAVLATGTMAGGAATVTAANLAVGVHTITAVYGGDAGNGGSSSTAVTVTVSKGPASVTLASSLNPSVAGQTVSFTATVTPAAASGSIQFLDGATVIGTVALSGGSAGFGTSGLAAGSHSITAVYGGNGNYNGATSGTVTQMVNAVTTTSLSSNKSTAVVGQTVTFTAMVAPAAATGSVQFLDGAAVIGTLPLSGGSAALSVSNLAVGSHSVTALYGGSTGYAGSTSVPVNVTITAGPPAAPSNLAATAASSSQINLSWTASATPGVTYNVYSSTTSGFTPSAGNRIATGLTTTSYAHTGLSASTTHYYVVKAQNTDGESASSNQASATTQPPPLSCHVGYTVTTQWNVGFGTAITIKNTGSTPINGWQLTWTWAGNQHITEAWNSTYTQNGANATVTNASWNSTIGAGATLNGVGFNASYSGSNPAPTAFFVNGTRCQ